MFVKDSVGSRAWIKRQERLENLPEHVKLFLRFHLCAGQPFEVIREEARKRGYPKFINRDLEFFRNTDPYTVTYIMTGQIEPHDETLTYFARAIVERMARMDEIGIEICKLEEQICGIRATGLPEPESAAMRYGLPKTYSHPIAHWLRQHEAERLHNRQMKLADEMMRLLMVATPEVAPRIRHYIRKPELYHTSDQLRRIEFDTLPHVIGPDEKIEQMHGHAKTLCGGSAPHTDYAEGERRKLRRRYDQFTRTHLLYSYPCLQSLKEEELEMLPLPTLVFERLEQCNRRLAAQYRTTGELLGIEFLDIEPPI